jgi:methylase of polypeptide subunit release factors
MTKKRNKVEFGDFQTPLWLCQRICQLLSEQGLKPVSILEPTCGQGRFIQAAVTQFSEAQKVIGVDINKTHIEAACQKLKGQAQLSIGNFFTFNWEKLLDTLLDPLLIIGNPPWVTNSELARLDSMNMPEKRNFQNHSGIEAMTGASNFDISEWMLLQMIGWLEERQGVLAMLCKTAVARKLLFHIWQNQPAYTAIYLIDAAEAFAVTVDACLFIYDTRIPNEIQQCPVYDSLASRKIIAEIGYKNGRLLANRRTYQQWQHLESGQDSPYRWRSGIKHDCARIMELQAVDDLYLNKLGETHWLENDYLYPMLKSSDVVGVAKPTPSRWMLVTQQKAGAETSSIQRIAPNTWNYLQKYAAFLDKRRSRIYQNQPRFAIFGVGDYSFALWKVAISGLYKQLHFAVIAPYEDKPVVLDDTCYFLACQCREEAELIAEMLNSEVARQFYQSFIFWDAKRPITAKILQQLDLFALAQELGYKERLTELVESTRQPKQLALLEIGD